MTRSHLQSAGVLFHRRRDGSLEVLLVHPGGPYFVNKDLGSWTIPKGEIDPGDEDLLACARREVHEELGYEPPPSAAAYRALGECQQRAGKIVHAWACEADVPLEVLGDSSFEIEWPPRSGQRKRFPEIDAARYFDVETARAKINPAQQVFLERLCEQLHADADT